MLNTKLLLFTLLPATLAGGCAQNPCQNGKKCYDLGEDDYECICEEFAGKHCQIRKSISFDLVLIESTWIQVFQSGKSIYRAVSDRGLNEKLYRKSMLMAKNTLIA